MDEEIGIVIFIILLILGGIIAFIVYNETQVKRDQEIEEEMKRQAEARRRAEEERKAEEQRKKEEKRRAEEEWRKSTRCLICGRPSNGYKICDDCDRRSEVLKKELPFKRICSYELINEYRNELMKKVIFPENQFERETNSVRLFSIADILKNKYCRSDAYDNTYDFLEDIYSNEYGSSEKLISKYDLNANPPQKENTSTDENQTDYRLRHEKPYRCADGDYVRSKAEREIDDFFFHNRIWHVYEADYTNKDGQKYYPDFYVVDYNLYIEYFGSDKPDYIEKRNNKIKMYSEDNTVKFEYLTYEDDEDIYAKLKDICIKHNIPLK